MLEIWCISQMCGASVGQKDKQQVLEEERKTQQNEALINEYGSIMEHSKEKCEITGLYMTGSLHYYLKKYLLLEDDSWLLAMIDIDKLKDINENIGYNNANTKIKFVGEIVKAFCDEKPNKTIGFKYKGDKETSGKGDMFAVLVKYSKKIENAQRKIESLMKRINDVINETICVGLAKMRRNENYKMWIKRAVIYLKYTKDKNGKGSLCSDINGIDDELEAQLKAQLAGVMNEDEEMRLQANEAANEVKIGKKYQLGNKKEFDRVGLEIAQKEDENWLLLLFDCDNLGAFNDMYSREIAEEEISNIENEMINLCQILGNEYCKAFKFGGDEFAMIIYDNKSEKELLQASQIVESLMENIRSNCKVTVSMGFSKYNSDDEETFLEWHDRCNKFLKVAKKTSGKNIIYWGQDVKKFEKHRLSLTLLNQVKEDDLIIANSLQEIEVCVLFLVLLHVSYNILK